jgi:hypothetical protein
MTVAAAFLIAAVGFTVWYVADQSVNARAWIPNVVTGLVGLAATITFAEWIVRRELQNQLGPRRERVSRELRSAFLRFVDGLVLDIRGDYPKDALVLLKQWLESPLSDHVPPFAGTGKIPGPFRNGQRLEDRLREIRSSDRDVLGETFLKHRGQPPLLFRQIGLQASLHEGVPVVCAAHADHPSGRSGA